MKDILIIGGGLAGLINAIQLSKAGFDVVLVEKKTYPFHRVCGEYISNEVVPFLESINAYPEFLKPAKINKLLVTAPSGRTLRLPLEMGGFGISRYAYDNFLYTLASSLGVKFILNTQVDSVKYSADHFKVGLSNGLELESKLVIGSFGKRSNIDRWLNRDFFNKRSPYIGVKYHIKGPYPADEIALHNFKDGYCGISQIENNEFCLCYLTSRENLKEQGDIASLEKNILSKNPYLKEILLQAEFLFDKPEVINEISFEKKSSVENHILLSGDAAGMITPLCGNGMAMAIHSAKILSQIIIKHAKSNSFNRNLIETEYSKEWTKLFEKRLYIGRKIQSLFGKESATDFSIALLSKSKALSMWLVKQTHGQSI